MGARALLEACCHAYYNEVEPAMRRGRPRMYFEGNNVDNDALLDLVRLLESRGDRWGIVVISKSGGTLETAAAFRILLRELRGTLGKRGEPNWRARRAGDRHERASCSSWPRRLGVARCFPVPDGVGGRFSVLSAVGLLPAALLGLDIE